MTRIRVLMVCMGNICRSPMAEAVFRAHVARAGLGDAFEIDSAGTGDWHVGSPPHPQTLAELRHRGVEAGDQRARQVTVDDLHEFDYVAAMDSRNLADLERLASDVHADRFLILDHAPGRHGADVPDPYNVGGYDHVFELVDAAAAGLLAYICEREGIAPRRMP